LIEAFSSREPLFAPLENAPGSPALNWFILAVTAGGALESAARYLVSIGFGRLLGSKLPWGNAVHRYHRVASDRPVRRPVRDAMESASGGAHLAHGRYLRRLHRISNILTPFLLPVRARRVAAAGACMIASVVLAVSALIAGIQIVRPL
jgi:CrcB protein